MIDFRKKRPLSHLFLCQNFKYSKEAQQLNTSKYETVNTNNNARTFNSC
jgi:hypothetical protein